MGLSSLSEFIVMGARELASASIEATVVKTYRTIISFDLLSPNHRPSLFREIGQAFVTFVIKALDRYVVKPLLAGSEPKISVKRDRQGRLFWQVWDPVTKVSATFYSQQDVMVWIEERYRH